VGKVSSGVFALILLGCDFIKIVQLCIEIDDGTIFSTKKCPAECRPRTPEYFMYENEMESTHSKTCEDYAFLDPGALDESLTPVLKRK